MSSTYNQSTGRSLPSDKHTSGQGSLPPSHLSAPSRTHKHTHTESQTHAHTDAHTQAHTHTHNPTRSHLSTYIHTDPSPAPTLSLLRKRDFLGDLVVDNAKQLRRFHLAAREGEGEKAGALMTGRCWLRAAQDRLQLRRSSQFSGRVSRRKGSAVYENALGPTPEVGGKGEGVRERGGEGVR